MPTVRLGNTAALDQGRLMDGLRVTTFNIVDDDDTSTRLRTIAHADGLWPQLSMRPAAWVEADDPELQAVLAEHFGCPVGKPDDGDWIE